MVAAIVTPSVTAPDARPIRPPGERAHGVDRGDQRHQQEDHAIDGRRADELTIPVSNRMAIHGAARITLFVRTEVCVADRSGMPPRLLPALTAMPPNRLPVHGSERSSGPRPPDGRDGRRAASSEVDF